MEKDEFSKNHLAKGLIGKGQYEKRTKLSEAKWVKD